MKKINPTIILVRPQLSENIGMAARVMGNFGLSKLSIDKSYKVIKVIRWKKLSSDNSFQVIKTYILKVNKLAESTF